MQIIQRSRPTFALLTGLGILSLASATDQPSAWTYGGDLRLRFEGFDHLDQATPARDFQRSDVDNSNSYFWHRETAHVGYTAGWFAAYLEAQNAGASSDENPKRPGYESADVYHAYVTLGDAKQHALTATLGRQGLAFGEQRLFGASSWSNSGRAFDAVHARWDNKTSAVDAFAGRIVRVTDKRFNRPDYHDWVSGVVFATKTLVPVQETQFYVFSRNTTVGSSTSPRDIYSLGTSVKSLTGKTGPWNYTAEFVVQLGSVNQGGVRREQRAFAFSAGVGHTWRETKGSPKVGLDYNYSSGDSDATDGRSETLDVMFGGNHSKYGVMDVVGWRNVHELRTTFNVKPVKPVALAVEVHGFWLADTNDFFYPQGGSGRSGLGYGRNAAYDNFLGVEATLEVTWTPKPWANVRAGAGRFFAGSYIEQSKAGVGGAADGTWSYLQTIFSF